MYRILTEFEWELLATQEVQLYKFDQGVHPFTSVRDREDSAGLAMLWDDAVAMIEQFVDQYSVGRTSRQNVMAAERVAKAQYHIVTGETVEVNILWERAVAGEELVS